MKDKTTAAIFALFLGWLGIHRFYLRQPGLGVLYIILVWTGISFFLGIIDFIVLLAMDPEEFDRRYNEEESEYDRYRSRRAERRDYRRTQDRPGRRRRSHNTRQRERRSYERERPSRRTTQRRSRSTTSKQQRKRVNPYKQSGIKKYKDFDLEAAIEDFNKGLEIDPNDIALHFNIACAYSLTEKADKAFYHISQAVENGFKDFDKIKNHDDLAYVRIQDNFDAFADNGFRLVDQPKQLEAPKQDLLSDDVLLSQLNRLSELKEKGLITEKEYLIEKQKLTG